MANSSYGQKFLDSKARIDFNNVTLAEALEQMAAGQHVKFAYSDAVIRRTGKISQSFRGKTIQEVLVSLLTPQQLTYKVVDDVVVIEEATFSDAKKQNQAQQTPVRGVVTDSKGEPLPGVSIRVKGTQVGAVTNANGEYSVNAGSDAVLVFSFIGFNSQEIPVGSRSNINVKLAEQNSALSEVVVVGYGTQKRVNVVGAVDQITSTAIEGKPSVNLTQALQGESPNLIIQQNSAEPGAYPRINIRGVSSLNNNNPLIVIDGITGGDLNLLNPQDIESVSVLKDAGSAAIYGSRSANGVILITTKKGKNNSPTTLTYNGQAGIQVPRITYRPVESYENAILRNESVVNAGLAPIYSPQTIRNFQEQGSNEWFLDAILKNAVLQNHNLALTGGSATSTYLVSAGVTDQRSNLVGPGYGLRRYNYRMNLNTQYGRLKLTSILSYARTEIKEHSYNTGTLIVDAGRTPTYYPIQDAQGNYLTNDVLTEFNPLGILKNGGYRSTDNDNVFANLTAELAITKDFKVRGVFGGTLFSNHTFGRVVQVNFLPKGVYGADRNTNDDNVKNLFINTQVLAEYNHTFKKEHNVGVLIGVANESTTNRSNYLRLKYTDPELGTPVTGTVIDPSSTATNNNTTENSLNSLFGRATYNFKNKYYGEVDFRVDASSRFAPQNRNAFFPSVSGGYRISEESFLENYRNKVGDIKLRGSYGILGSQSAPDYAYLNTYRSSPDAYAFGGSSVSGTGITFVDPNIRWERAATLNLGVDASFLRNALTVSFDYFDKTTSDILLQPVISGAYGATISRSNIAKVQNRGWELNLNYRINGKNFNHSFNFNVGDTKNKVLALASGDILNTYDEMRVIDRVGLPIGSYVGLKRDGYFQNLNDVLTSAKPTGLTVVPGDNKYVDVNGDGVIDNNDSFVLGNAFPRLTFGFTYAVNYKQFDFNMFWQGVGKRSTFIRGEQVEPFHFGYSQVIYQHQLDYWTPLNPDARYPRLAANGSQSNENNFRRGSDMYLFNASYLRLKNIQLGYTLPLGVAKAIGMKKVRAYLSGQNLLTFSGLKFLDPETTEFDTDLRAGNGANSGRSYPTPVYYGFGIDITL
ncbi:TonB-dependent receptor [Mucilaginibacter koreensis]